MHFKRRVCAIWIGLTTVSFSNALDFQFPNSWKPSETELVKNAGLALNQKQDTYVIQSWLLMNNYLWFKDSMEDRPQDKQLLESTLTTLAWVAGGRLGVCLQDLPKDAPPAGPNIWPLAFLDSYLIHSRRGKGKKVDNLDPWQNFQKPLHTRKIGWNYKTTLSEIQSFKPKMGSCDDFNFPMWSQQKAYNGSKLHPRTQFLYTQYQAMAQSLSQTRWDKVTPKSILEARLLDLQIQATSNLRKSDKDFAPYFGKWEILLQEAKSIWTSKDWMLLPPARRLYIIQKVYPPSDKDTNVLHQEKILSILDHLTEKKLGSEVNQLIALFPDSEEYRKLFWHGTRGQNLLALDASSGFVGQGVIGLYRGIWHFENGRTREAMENISRSVAAAAESTLYPEKQQQLRGVAKRWLAHVLRAYQMDSELISMIQTLLPREDSHYVLETLAWRSLLVRDPKSLQLVLQSIKGNPGWVRKISAFQTAAKGQLQSFATQLEKSLSDEPSFHLKALGTLIEHLESSSLDTKQKNTSLMITISNLLERFERKEFIGASQKSSVILRSQLESILKGTTPENLMLSPGSSIRSLGSQSRISGGVIQVVPLGDIPWPFEFLEPELPAPLSPLQWEITKCCIDGVHWRISEKEERALPTRENGP